MTVDPAAGVNFPEDPGAFLHLARICIERVIKVFGTGQILLLIADDQLLGQDPAGKQGVV